MSEFKDYCCTYRFDNADWAFTIRARSSNEARARLRALGTNGTVDGELMAEIPAALGAGFIVRLVCWFQNLFAANGKN